MWIDIRTVTDVTNKHLTCVIVNCTRMCLQCFDAVGWAAGRVSGL